MKKNSILVFTFGVSVKKLRNKKNLKEKEIFSIGHKISKMRLYGKKVIKAKPVRANKKYY